MKTRSMLLWLGTFGSLGMMVNCGGDSAQPAPAGETATVTYHQTIRPLLEKHCVNCHSTGNIGPFSLNFDESEWSDGAPGWAALAVQAVEKGEMPPWMASETCKPISGERRLSDTEKAAFSTWKAEGFPQGSPQKYVPPQDTGENKSTIVGSPSVELDPGFAYQAKREREDDYHCFVFPNTFDQDTYITATDVTPGEKRVVHHVLLYTIPPESIQTIKDLDAAEDGPGYTCFGGPGTSTLNTIGAWVPGAVPRALPEGAAMVLPKGSQVVMQVHYNTLNITPSETVPEDRTKVSIWTMPADQKPTQRVEVLPLAHLGLSINAGDANSRQERVFSVPADSTLIAVAPHMHNLGKEIKVEQVKGPNNGEQCLVDIPKWDFHWQQTYGFPQDGWVPLKAGDQLRLSCTYDNSPANQTPVSGMKPVPQNVTWGEGTRDEMCLAYVSLMVPFESPKVLCGPGFKTCFDQCPENDDTCLYNCSVSDGGQCASCLLPKVGSCAPAFCATSGLEFGKCLKTCTNNTTCIATTCSKEFGAFQNCMAPHIKSGECNTHLSACNVTY
jgi:hypothetical protein